MNRSKRAAVAGGIAIALACLATATFTSVERQQASLRLADAVRKGAEADVQALLVRGADPNAPIQSPNVTLADVLRVMLRLKPPEATRETILVYAAAHSNERVLRSLLEAGGDVHRQTEYEELALTRAVEARAHRNVELLVQHGANLNCYGQLHTPLSAVFNRVPDPEDLFFLLAHGADPNGHDAYGITPLMWAAFEGDPKSIKTLIHVHADIDRRDTVGATALIHAALVGNLQTIEALLKAGADPTLRDLKGRTAEDIAVITGNKPLAVLLHDCRRYGAHSR